METTEKSDDKKIIELEEREKILNSENKSSSPPILEIENGIKLNKTDIKEGREVQPKKIPIGGIQMPGFFTRSKSKERCKDTENDQNSETEGVELLQAKEEEEVKGPQTRIKLPNPFRKSKLINEDEGEKTPEPKEKKKLLNTIRLPLVSVFPRKKKEDQISNQSAKAGLASIETLDETDKSADRKEDDLKNVCLDVNIDEKCELEKQQPVEQPSWKHKVRAYRIIISAFLVLIMFIIIIVTVTLPIAPEHSVAIRDGRFVETITSCGKVEGVLEDGAVAFRGIPYARPPIGELRFKAAHPLNSISYCWNNTTPLLTHNATDYCLQIYSNGTTAGTEDCLTLDVVTPYVRYDTPLPVVVLIGTESLIGGSPGKMRPSARYARSRDVIFVRPNFRLGVLGFLAVSQLTQSVHLPTSGNYGLSDIVEALRWVQYNIEHFGGDRKSVTLFGHRAGATLVTALSAMKGAEKLFKQAWATSGGAIYPGKTLVEYEMENKNYMPSIQCETAQCLLDADADMLVSSVIDTWRKPQPDLPSRLEEPDKRHEWLVLDGNILKEHPGKVWASEEGFPVKLVLGTTAHAAASETLYLKYKSWSEDLVQQHIKESKLGQLNMVDEILKLYPSTYQGLSAMISDIRIVCPLLAVSTQMRNVPFYVVTQNRGELNVADVDSDVDAILGRYEPKTAEQKRYVSAMQQLFYYYVWHGKIQPVEHINNKILIVEQDVLLAANYTHCDYWITKDIVPRYAQLD
ncbi:hypothetical protein PPYR_07445 [Photinus pyralis]|uniref:Carboxylesterase type B domain-containing protein n=1 Tax=Photinus pyralis TaxID=7054 RepID=A0A5N4AQC8_PHOPY|nr:neurotactin-like isoform X2 [Photinus pyralis]XP_031339750.1 neurotactin-like isoform X2 [Photinus pyralis]KAB0799565.1 hypothetical protein PPYR_07445 [Photinus pyralis]